MEGKVYINNCVIPLDEFPKDLLSLSELYDICDSDFWARYELHSYDEIVSVIRDIAMVERRYVAAADLGIDEEELEDCNVCICLPSTEGVAILGKAEDTKSDASMPGRTANTKFDYVCDILQKAKEQGLDIMVDGREYGVHMELGINNFDRFISCIKFYTYHDTSLYIGYRVDRSYVLNINEDLLSSNKLAVYSISAKCPSQCMHISFCGKSNFVEV